MRGEGRIKDHGECLNIDLDQKQTHFHSISFAKSRQVLDPHEWFGIFTNTKQGEMARLQPPKGNQRNLAQQCAGDEPAPGVPESLPSQVVPAARPRARPHRLLACRPLHCHCHHPCNHPILIVVLIVIFFAIIIVFIIVIIIVVVIVIIVAIRI